MALDVSTFGDMLKDHYAPGMVENIGFDENRGLALIKKSMGNLDVGGSKWVQPVGTRLPNQGSSSFTVANSATNNQSKHDRFEPTHAAHYRVARIDNQVIKRTAQGNVDAFEPALEETEKAIKAESNWANFRLFRSRGGAIGRMTNTGFATAVMTVDDPAALWAVSDGDVLQLSVADGTTGAVKAGSLTVASVQHATPDGVATITLTGNISAGVATAAANDYVFLNGDFSLAPAGFADYVPDTAVAAATTLFGFDRSVNNLLGGQIVNGIGLTVSETIINMLSAHMNAGGAGAMTKKVIFGHPYTFGTMSKQTEGKWVLMQAANYDGSKSASIGIKVFNIQHLGTEVSLVWDRMCPVNRLYLVDLNKWVMFHAGTFPFFLTEQFGDILKPSETADAWECRVGGYLNYCTKSPHTNVVGLVG